MKRPLPALLLCLAGAAAAGAGGPRHACNVEDVQGTGVTVLRDQAPPAPLLPYSPLFEGDRLVLANDRSRVTVLCGGERRVLSRGMSPWSVPTALSPPGRAANVMAWLSDFFGTAERHGESVASLRVRGDEEPLSLPLLAGADGAFAAGRRALSLAWSGGEPPFSVRVYRAADDRTVLAAKDIEARRVRLTGEPVAAGPYELEVRDARGKVAGARLRALAPAELPQMPQIPPAFAAAGPDDRVGRTLEAGWLAGEAGGRLAFEAYQRAGEIAEEHAPARALRDALEQGLRPDSPPISPTPPAPPTPPSPAAGPVKGRALLVGCSTYIHLARKWQLQGGENDAALMRELLTGDRFRFDPARVTLLAGWPADEQRRPTRANIARAFARLAAEAGRGEVVVVFLAGHGSQEPAEADPDEPDGLDEIFLPADVAGWNGRTGHVEGAIRDDEIRAWVTAIRDRGAFVWLLVDACHAGTLVRGTPTAAERERRLPVDQLVPKPALATARRPAARGGGIGGDTGLLGLSRGASDLAALYAAQPDEVTPEMPLPGVTGVWHGLLTWTVAEVLSASASPLTYRELAERVTARYRTLSRFSPTPVLEGDGLDRRVLGLEEWPDRPKILLAGASPDRPGSVRVRAGHLLGLLPGSILRVYPPAGAPQADRPLGYVEIVRAGALESLASPVTWDAAPAPLPAALVEGARCEPVLLQYGELALRLAVQRQDEGAAGGEEPEPVTLPRGSGPPDVEAAVARLEKEGGLVRRVDDAREADWYVRTRGKDVFLVPSSGWPGRSPGRAPGRERFALTADRTATHLASLLGRVARARGLLAVAGAAERTGGGQPEREGAHLELLRATTAGSPPTEPVPFGPAGRVLRGGDRVAFRITNPYRHPADVTLLFVDNGYGITPLFPAAAEYNRLGPGESVTTGTFTVDEKTTGPEQVVALAVRGGAGAPVSFAYLAQPALEPVQSRSGDPDRGISALARLLESVLYGRGEARTPTIDEASGYSISFLGWTTLPARGGT